MIKRELGGHSRRNTLSGGGKEFLNTGGHGWNFCGITLQYAGSLSVYRN
jgi:hypothetical protein